MFIIAKVTINYKDLIKTIQWSLLEFPKNINIIVMIITHIADLVKVLEAYCKFFVVLSYIIYFAILELIMTESFLN